MSGKGGGEGDTLNEMQYFCVFNDIRKVDIKGENQID